ncbi:acyl-CoA dehydrogenase family protein [Actinophytocola sp.]|uniref:acyl-CoA dehydrogenase family protein n=1 Tax=Actinophytocola sp. TaxID=1872138 RepID=UPI003D6AD071
MQIWSSEQQRLRGALAAWSADLNADHVAADAAGRFPQDKWKLIQRTDLLRIPFDERWGGLGQDLLTTMYLLEGLGHECRDGGLNFSVSTHLVSAGIPIQRFGRDSLKARFLPAICDGDTVGAHAITEPESGSDALAMRTTARKDGDRYVLDGSKTFVSNGSIADVFVVYARTHPDGGPLGITPFVVERGTPGFTTGNPIAKMGLRTSPLTELFFDGCRVPAENVIGRPGGGFLVLDHVMKWEILCSFVINLGEMEHRLERVIAYAKERSAFGSPIGSFQAVSHRIADMKIGVETTRKWLYDTAAKFAAGENVTTDLAITKLVASEQNVASAMAAVQILGGNGYMAEYGVEKDLRNAVAGTIYSGTSEIQRNRIASALGLGGSRAA